MSQQDELVDHVLDAEIACIGVVLHDGTAVDEMPLNGGDFRDPRYGALWDLLKSMATRGEPTAPAAVLPRLSALEVRIEPTVLLDAFGQAPLRATAGHYARIVADAGARRRLYTLGTRMQQMAEGGLGAERIIEEVRAALDRHTPSGAYGRMVGESIVDMVAALEEPTRAMATPWNDLNTCLTGWRPGAFYVVGARPGVGKALALDTPLPTPGGWTTMGEVQVGDRLIGRDGAPVRVTGATEVMHGRPCFRVDFSDGTSVVADAEHQWLTETRASRRAATPPAGYEYRRDSPFSRDQRHLREVASVKTTASIARTVRVGSDSRANHSIPAAQSLSLVEADLPLDPYLLGYWLGDGHSAHAVISVGAEDLSHLLSEVERAGYHSATREDGSSRAYRVTFSTAPIRRGGVAGDSARGRLRELGILGRKHIPAVYLRASEAQREALLAGLLDSDGTASAQSGRVSLDLTDGRLARDALELVRSLGYVPSLRTRRVLGRSERSSTCYRIGFMARPGAMRLPRKAARLRPSGQRAATRYITAVTPIISVPVRCVEVDAPDHLYLAGEGMVPTHNSILGLQAAMGLSQHGYVALSSLEMTEREVLARIIAQRAHVPLGRLFGRSEHHARLTESDHQAIGRAMVDFDRMRISIDDRSGISVADVRQHARQLRKRGPLSGIVVDYLQLMAPAPGDRRPRHEVVAAYSRELKILAREMDCPVIALSQLNREGVRADREPSLADLRESGAIEQDADVVLLMHTPDPLSDMLDLIVAKNRHGVQARVLMLREGAFARLIPRPRGMSTNV